jgi:hypothetical protein
MKDTERTKRINDSIDSHYKSNKGCWWVSNGGVSNMITLHKGGINNIINPDYVCKLIFDTEKSVDIIHVVCSCTTHTRESLKSCLNK